VSVRFSMRYLTTKYKLDDFLQKVRTARKKALLLDFDGTLAPFHPDPAAVVLYPGVKELLDTLLELQKTRVVVVTGRFTEHLIPLLTLEQQPEIWGSHGLERLRVDGRYEVVEVDARANRGLERATEWARSRGLLEKCDQKPGCLALNLRGVETAMARRTRKQALEDWNSIASESGLSFHETDGGLELRVPSRDKGDAVASVRSELGDNALLAYLGDDLTDEDAFRMLGPTDLGVLVRPELRSTAADLWIQPPGELLEFLTAWVNADRLVFSTGESENP